MKISWEKTDCFQKSHKHREAILCQRVLICPNNVCPVLRVCGLAVQSASSIQWHKMWSSFPHLGFVSVYLWAWEGRMASWLFFSKAIVTPTCTAELGPPIGRAGRLHQQLHSPHWHLSGEGQLVRTAYSPWQLSTYQLLPCKGHPRESKIHFTYALSFLPLLEPQSQGYRVRNNGGSVRKLGLQEFWESSWNLCSPWAKGRQNPTKVHF